MTVCFFMVYHSRPQLTKMSIDDMHMAMSQFKNHGITCKALVIGDSYNVAQFCHDRGIRHEMFANKPIAHKFTYAWLRAMQQNTDYICWYGSNNVHSAGYWETCVDVMNTGGNISFGTTNCVIMSTQPRESKTCLFHPSERYLISSGQFFLRSALMSNVNLLTLYEDDQTFSFDGSLMDQLFENLVDWEPRVVTYDEEDCIDVKGNVNIHSYTSYMKAGYAAYEDRSVIIPRHPVLQLYFNGLYD